MSQDLFDDLLQLEDEFYREGYQAGITDSTYAGTIEGKVFGIEKGYEKAIDLAKLHGRAIVWQARLRASSGTTSTIGVAEEIDAALFPMKNVIDDLARSSRLEKNIADLLVLSDGTTLPKENSDEAVELFESRLSRTKAKAKIVANVVGEPLDPAAVANASIEDATGLSARR